MAGRGMPPTGQVGPQWAAAGSGSEEKVVWRQKMLVWQRRSRWKVGEQEADWWEKIKEAPPV